MNTTANRKSAVCAALPKAYSLLLLLGALKDQSKEILTKTILRCSPIIDAFDEQILRHLQSEARITYTSLAARVGLSANATADRVRRLISSRAILGFRAEISPVVAGLMLQAYVDVNLSDALTADAIEDAIAEIPGILGMTVTTGPFEYSLRVACKDQTDLVRLVEALRVAIPTSRTTSRIILYDRPIFPKSTQSSSAP